MQCQLRKLGIENGEYSQISDELMADRFWVYKCAELGPMSLGDTAVELSSPDAAGIVDDAKLVDHVVLEAAERAVA